MNDPEVFHSPCAICKVNKATRWCDFIIRYDRNPIFVRGYEIFKELNSTPNDESCDLPLCEKCTYETNRADLCPHHHKLQQQVDLPKHLQKAQAKEKVKIYRNLFMEQ